jgi:hypothetical protein
MFNKRRPNGWWWALAYPLVACLVYAGHRHLVWRVEREKARIAEQQRTRNRDILAKQEPQRLARALDLCMQYFRSHPDAPADVDISVISEWAVGRGLASAADFCSRRLG